jgi:hypothetical protein
MKKHLLLLMTFVMLGLGSKAQDRLCSDIPKMCDEISDWCAKSRKSGETYKMYRFLNEALMKYDTLMEMSTACNCPDLYDWAITGKDLCKEGMDSKDWSVTREQALKAEEHAAKVKRLYKKCPSKKEEE